MLPFLGMQLLNRSTYIETKVYTRPINTGLLLHHQSHVDERYKRSLIRTMLHRAYRLSSSWSYFNEECERLRRLFSRLKYLDKLVSATIQRFVNDKICEQQEPTTVKEPENVVRIVLPFKDQRAADVVRKQLENLSSKTATSIQPVSHKSEN